MVLKTTLCALALSLSPLLERCFPIRPEAGPQARQPTTLQGAAHAKQQGKPQKTAEPPPEGKQPSTDVELLPIEANIVKYTNAQRARYGLASLTIDRGLMKSARQHASWMARNRRLVHTRRPVAENIAMGYRHSRSVVGGWMNSPGHRANILSRSHRRIGVAAYRTKGGIIYWCQQFRR